MQAQAILRDFYRRFTKDTRQADRIFIGVVLMLTLLGLLMAYSTTYFWSYEQENNPMTLFLRQLMWAGVGLAAFVGLSLLDFGHLRRIALPVMGAMILLLIAVRLFGDDVFGARRSLFNGSVQPSELTKIVVIIYASAWLASRKDSIGSFADGMLPFGVVIGVVAGLVLLQPDLSTAFVIGVVAFAMFFMAGADIKQILALMVIGGIALFLAVNLFSHSSDRIEAFSKNWRDPLSDAADYHIRQLMLTLGGAGLFGHGIGASYQKFGLLPTPHTDSVLAVLTDEMGLIGLFCTFGLFGLFAWRGISIGQRANTPFGANIAIGITVWVTLQTLMNTLSVLSMIPFTGVPVPFLSVGGSSLVSLLVACGILVSVSRGSKVDEDVVDGREKVLDRPGIARKLRQRGVKAFHASTSVSGRNRRARAARAHNLEGATDNGGGSSKRFGQDIGFVAKLKRERRRNPVRWRG